MTNNDSTNLTAMNRHGSWLGNGEEDENGSNNKATTTKK